MAEEGGAVAGGSLKAALDLEWDDPSLALTKVLGALEAVEEYLQSDGLFEPSEVVPSIEAARRVAEVMMSRRPPMALQPYAAGWFAFRRRLARHAL